jgi:hypothetical protein
MKNKLLRHTVARLLLWLPVLGMLGSAAADEYEQFYDAYDGEAFSNTDGTLQTRDLSVTIEETNGGFNLTWTLETQ